MYATEAKAGSSGFVIVVVHDENGRFGLCPCGSGRVALTRVESDDYVIAR
jgi:hypothetical protein